MDAVTLGMAKADARKRYQQANTIAWLGDSIVGNGDGPLSPGSAVVNVSYHTSGFWVHSQNLLSHRLRFLGNYGVGGDTTAQILARTPTVVAAGPAWCGVMGGSNDVSNAVAPATTRANLTAIWDMLDAAGIRVVACTIPPHSSYTGNVAADTESLNTFIRNAGRTRKGLVVVDTYASVVATGGNVYAGGMTLDGIHPSAMGAYKMGKAVFVVMDSLVPRNVQLSSTEGEASNLIKVGGRFNAGGNGSANTGTNYSDHMGAGTAWTKQERTDGVNGNWQVFTQPNGVSGFVQFNIPLANGFAVGDEVIASVEYDIGPLDQAASAVTQAFCLRLQSYNGSVASDMILDNYWVSGMPNQTAQSRAGVLRTPRVVVPAGTQQLLMIVSMNAGGTFKLDRATCFNATALGMVGH